METVFSILVPVLIAAQIWDFQQMKKRIEKISDDVAKIKSKLSLE
jgi:hypothetical protein